MKQRLLVNFVYWPAVGHLMEALRATLGYHRANPEIEISLVVNRRTPGAVAKNLPWIQDVYFVDIPDASTQVGPHLYEHLPRNWDYVAYCGIADPFGKAEAHSKAFGEYARQTRGYFEGVRGFGYCGDPFLPYGPDDGLNIPIDPEKLARMRVRMGAGSPQISILPAGAHQAATYPSLQSWQLILDALKQAHPKAKFHFLGNLRDASDGNRSGFDPRGFASLLARYPGSISWLDAEFADKLTVLKASDLLVSPHSGFAFSALSVGTPWLCLAGGFFPESYFNGTPFYSVLPDPKRYPCYGMPGWNQLFEDDGPRLGSMSRTRFLEDIDEIVAASKLLINQTLSYEQCLERHFHKSVEFHGGDIERFIGPWYRANPLPVPELIQALNTQYPLFHS